MVSALALVGLAVLVAGHTAIAAILTRLFRVRLETRWGPLVYIATVIPIVLLISTLGLTGLLGLGPDLGGTGAALFVMIAIPLAVGVTIDYVWMPSPDEVDLPDVAD